MKACKNLLKPPLFRQQGSIETKNQLSNYLTFWLMTGPSWRTFSCGASINHFSIKASPTFCLKIDDDVRGVKLDGWTWPQRCRHKMSRWRTSVGQWREGRLATGRDQSADGVTVRATIVGVTVDAALGRLASDGAWAAATSARLPRVGRLQARVKIVVCVLERGHVIRIGIVENEIVLDRLRSDQQRLVVRRRRNLFCLPR